MTDPPQADFYTGWIANQPRALEAAGLEWNGLRYNDWAVNEYTDVIAASDEMLETEEGREIVRRFMRATYRGLQFLIENPKESAEIAAEYGVEAELTAEQALWRFNIQEENNMIVGEDGEGLMYMDPDSWNNYVATLLQYGQVEMNCE
jgi:ABC-type nitrate/sulfonate/bicarbonate transport system substrate-binding protein